MSIDDQYKARLRDHAAWLRTGRSLIASADLLWPKLQATWDQMSADSAAAKEAYERGGPVELIRVVQQRKPLPITVLTDHAGFGASYLLMAGYGVENLLTAIRVKRLAIEGKPIAFGGGADRIPKSHSNYVEMAEAEQIGQLSDREKSVLRRLSLFVRWAGRYPVSIEPPPLDEWDRYVDKTDKDDVDAHCRRLVERYESLR